MIDKITIFSFHSVDKQYMCSFLLSFSCLPSESIDTNGFFLVRFREWIYDYNFLGEALGKIIYKYKWNQFQMCFGIQLFLNISLNTNDTEWNIFRKRVNILISQMKQIRNCESLVNHHQLKPVFDVLDLS